MKVGLDVEGWPKSSPELFADVAPHNPDGSIVDRDGNLWNAQWGSSRIAGYAASGEFIRAEKFEASHLSCPAFGGSGLDQLFVTSATQGLADYGEHDGKTLIHDFGHEQFRGQQEHQVVLGA